jgi:hypothetical protein
MLLFVGVTINEGDHFAFCKIKKIKTITAIVVSLFGAISLSLVEQTLSHWSLKKKKKRERLPWILRTQLYLFN